MACLLMALPAAALATQGTSNSTTVTTSSKATTLTADTSRVRNIEEVVVVSQPKESTLLRNLPVASNIFSVNEINNMQIKSLSDLSALIPAFSMPAYGSRLTSSIYVRGIGSRTGNPAAGIYVDGMPLLSKSAFNTHIYQLDRIDVMRGPQGTLYGMNTEGGLVRLFTKNPLAHKGTDIRLGLGNHLQRKAEFTQFIHLADGCAMSLSGFYNGQNGFFKNATTGKRADSGDEAGGRLRLVKQIGNALTLDFSTDYQYTNQQAFAYGIMDVAQGTISAPETNHPNSYKRNLWNSVLNISYRRPTFSLHSTTSYQFLSDRMTMDQDYSRLDYMHLKQAQLQNGITEELVLKTQGKGIWHSVSGIFVSRLWQRTDAPVYFDKDFNDNLTATIQSAIPSPIVSIKGVEMSVPGLFHTPQTNLGIYHESQLDITPRLTLNIGLRYDLSHVKVDYDTSALMDMTVSVRGQEFTGSIVSHLQHAESNSFNQVLPKLGLTWRLADNGSNVYAIVCKGYRAGGYNIQMFSDILQSELRAASSSAMRGGMEIEHTAEDYQKINSTIAYKPELSWNYELGAHLNLFGGRMQADIAAYYIKIRNQQLSVMAGTYGFGRMMVNAGRSHSCGAELSLRGSIFDNRLAWSAGYSFTNSVFDNYTEEASGSEGTTTDYSGKRVPFIPQHTMSATADWTFPIAGKQLSAIVIGANLKAQGKTYWDEGNTYGQNFYALLGAHVDARFKHIGVSLWAKNITSTRYTTFAFSSSATGSKLYLAQRGTPFQLDVDVDFRF